MTQEGGNPSNPHCQMLRCDHNLFLLPIFLPGLGRESFAQLEVSVIMNREPKQTPHPSARLRGTAARPEGEREEILGGSLAGPLCLALSPWDPWDGEREKPQRWPKKLGVGSQQLTFRSVDTRGKATRGIHIVKC